MSRCVVDASVAVKWFVPEVQSEAAVRLLDGRHELLAPDLLWAEFGNVIWKKVRQRELEPEEARGVVRALERVPLQMRTNASLAEPALEIALGTGRSVYDALYLALAVLEGCPVVTGDLRLVRSLAGGPLEASVRWVEVDL